MPDPTPEPSDDTLMQAFAGGDARAFERLYARHHVALYRFVRRLLGSACAAQTDEVFQDTWLRVIDARTRWAPQGASFRTWLFTLGHHRAVDCLRKSGREVSVDAPGSDPWEPDGEPWARWPVAHGADGQGVDDQAFWRAAGQRLLDCLEGLPAAQKAVFLLHHEDGLSLAELAAALELGFETAKSRLRYAMSKLRTCMGAYLPGAGVLTAPEGERMNRPHPPEPAGNDDDVARDAHLRAALRHAPDRDARPPAELSRRILDAARAAAGSAPKRTARPAAARWARVRDGFASCTAWLRHPGATAAFASLMLATVIGVMWRDGPPPETEPVHDGAAPAGPSTAPSAAATAAAPVADRPPARHDEPAETAADAAARDAAAATARRADHDDGGRREAAAPRPRATGSAPSGPPAGKAAAQEKRRSAAPEAANPPVAASPPPPPMAASPAAPAVTPSDRAGAAAQNQAPLGATAERSGLDDGPSAQAAPLDDPLAAPIAALRGSGSGSGGAAPARLARRGAAAAVAPSSAAGRPPSALAWFGDAQALTRGRWRPAAATPSAALPTAWTDALSTDGRTLGRVAILEGTLWWQPAGTDGRTWRAPLPAGDAAQRLAAALASGALDRSPPPP